MSLSSDSAVLTMPVQPANTNGGNGFGFGNDGATHKKGGGRHGH